MAMVLVPCENPVRRVNEIFPAQENLRHPRCQEIRDRFGLDKVVRGEPDEFRRILLLRHWVRRRMAVSNAHPSPVRMEAISILDRARSGGRFHCAHFSLVQHAVLNAFGHVARRLGAGNGDRRRGRFHGVNEVWVNALCKWVLVDAKYDTHFEKDGVPLSALEIRDEVLADGGKRIEKVRGPQRRRSAKGRENGARTYRWIAWEPDTSHFTDYPVAGSSVQILFDDAYARTHTWYRDGAPHWAYEAGYFLRIPKRSWIEWTPNVIASDVRIRGSRATIALSSCTPNLKTYLRQVGGQGAWRGCADRMEVVIPRTGLQLAFRVRNLAGMDGPVHALRFVRSGERRR